VPLEIAAGAIAVAAGAITPVAIIARGSSCSTADCLNCRNVPLSLCLFMTSSSEKIRDAGEYRRPLRTYPHMAGKSLPAG
jgi:hypothetical protein